jgi:prepilin-type N-terminal cleavage/methylation domain-containing protein
VLSEGHEVKRLTRFFSNTGGFSFIELTVVIALIGILTAFMVPSLISFVQAQRTQGAARELIAFLNQARQLAITRNVPFSVEVQATPQDRLRFCFGTVTPCPLANVWAGPGTRTDGWMGMANGDRITLAPLITFNQLGAAAPGGTLRVQNAAGTSCLDVVVSVSGRMRIAPAGACP